MEKERDDPALGARRAFLRNMSVLTAAGYTASAVSVGALLSPPMAHAESEQQGRENSRQDRLGQSFRLKREAALADLEAGLPRHPNNGDERLYPNFIGNFSKGLPHDSLGEVNRHAYAGLLQALLSGNPADFEDITLGGNVRLVDPQAGLAFDMEGLDSHQFVEIPSPALASAERAAEAVENYWQALLRDVNFTDYPTNAVALAACAELSALGAFTGPRQSGQVTPQTLFRGFTPGDVVGPYVSQFLLQPISFGALPITQQFTTYAPGVDYLTDPGLAARNGQGPFASNSKDSVLRYLRNGRDLAAWVHVDALVQAYFHALLWLLGNAVAFNAGNPYNHSTTQAGFGTFGGPHVIALLSEVSSRALKAQWYQKWFVHRALRPEELGGLVHWTKTGAAHYPLHPDILNSPAGGASVHADGHLPASASFSRGLPSASCLRFGACHRGRRVCDRPEGVLQYRQLDFPQSGGR